MLSVPVCKGSDSFVLGDQILGVGAMAVADVTTAAGLLPREGGDGGTRCKERSGGQESPQDLGYQVRGNTIAGVQ